MKLVIHLLSNTEFYKQYTLYTVIILCVFVQISEYKLYIYIYTHTHTAQ
jgi:hypothetical protein